MRKTALLAFLVAGAFASNTIEMYKSPTCGCCSKWGEIMEKSGFEVKTNFENDVVAVKNRFNVPLELSSCHTAIIDGYVIEGHVPADEVKRLLELKPEGVVGISTPGMPLHSPGMEQGDTPDMYDVVLFKKDGSREIFATYVGSKKIK